MKISETDDVTQMLNFDQETVLRLEKAVYALVNSPKNGGTDSRNRSSNMDSQVVPSIHVHLFFRRIGKNPWSAQCACL